MPKKMKPISEKDYKIHWNKNLEKCEVRLKNGQVAELGCGVSDSVSVYSDGNHLFVLSINYPARYACLEAFSRKGLDQAVLAESKDIDKMFGNLSSHSPESIASRLFKELD